MATNKKITELTELVGADLANDDVIPIVDISAGTTHKIQKSTLAAAVSGVATIAATSPIAVDTATGDVTVSTGTIPVASGGTGATSLTDGSVLLGSGTGAVTPMAVLADSEMIVGDGTTDPVAESGATLRTSIGVGTGDSPQFTAVNIGAATDTTVARSGAGDITVEGNAIYRAGGTDVPVTDGGTGASSASAAATALGVGTGDSPQFTAVNIGAATDTTLARSGAGDLTVEGNALYRAGGTDVAIADGGTGASTLTANNVIMGNGTSALQFVAPSTSGNVLTSNGSTWASTAAGGGGSWTVITSTDVSGDPGPSEIVYTNLDSTAYQNYVLVWSGISNSSGGGALQIRISEDNGSNYDEGDNYRWWTTNQSDTSTAWAKDFSSGGTAEMRIGYVPTDTDGRGQGRCYFSGTEAGATPIFAIQWESSSVAGANYFNGLGLGSWEDTSVFNCIKVYTAVAWDKGRITLYGLSYS